MSPPRHPASVLLTPAQRAALRKRVEQAAIATIDAWERDDAAAQRRLREGIDAAMTEERDLYRFAEEP